MRTKLTFELKCSECGTLLKCDAEKTKFTANCAFSENASFAIKPCERCISIAERPLNLLREALDGVDLHRAEQRGI